MKYLGWTSDALLVMTERGLYIWTTSYHPYGHVYRPASHEEVSEIEWHTIEEPHES